MTLKQDRFPGDAANQAEETLRVLSRLPAPEGLVQRVQAGLEAAPRRRSWFRWSPLGFDGWMHSGAMRGLAAACIVCVVAGGAWQISMRVQVLETPSAATMPARIGNQGGFSTAGAVRKPDTANGPVLTHQMQKPVSSADADVPVVAPKKAQPSAKPRKHSTRTLPSSTH